MEPPNSVEVNAEFHSSKGDRQELRSRAEESVTHWRWATGWMHRPEPLFFERLQVSRGRWLKQRPDRIQELIEYGLDELGRVHVARDHLLFESGPGPARHYFYETLYFYSDNRITRYWYDYHPESDAHSFTQYEVTDGLIRSALSRSVNGGSFEKYEYLDQLPHVIETWHAPADESGAPGAWLPERRFIVKYTADGKLDELHQLDISVPQDPPPAAYLMFKRLPPGTTLNSMIADVEAALYERIVSAVRSHNVAEPAYCLVLAWSPDQAQSLPPSLAIGLQAHRATVLQRDQAEWEDYLWNPAEYGDAAWIELRDDRMEEICRNLNQYCNMKGSWARVRRMLNDIATALSGRDWGDEIPRTPDFFAYVTDLELQDLHAGMKASCPPETFKSLALRGLIRARTRRSKTGP